MEQRDEFELTDRQREVLARVQRGLANKEIAHELSVGTDDVKRIVSRLLARFDAPNRTALAAVTLPGSPNFCGYDLDFLTHFEEAPVAILATVGPDHVSRFANRAAVASMPTRPEQRLVGTALRAALAEGDYHEFLALVDRSFWTGDVSVASRVRFGRSSSDAVSDLYLDVRVEPLRERQVERCGLLIFLVSAGIHPLM